MRRDRPAPFPWPRRTSARRNGSLCWPRSTPASSPPSDPRSPSSSRSSPSSSAPGTRWPRPAGLPPCTSALRLAGVGPGDEVFVSDFTFIGSANPVAYLGAEVVLVDSEPTSWNMDPDLLEQELDRRARSGEAMPRAIELVHVLGQPAEGHRIAEIARRHGVVLIEDAAESLGAGWVDDDGLVVSTGTLGALGAYSFNGNKIVTAGGGGMIVTDDDEAARRARAPDHPGQGARCRLPARRGRLQLPTHQPGRRARPGPAPAARRVRRRQASTSRHATTRRSPISR